MDAVKDFPDESLDFVFIDADHRFEYVINDVIEWSKKVRPGGLIISHDYVRRRSLFVQTYWAVNAWVAANMIHPWIVFEHKWEDTVFWVKNYARI
jgi:predicted O-methyltransferase YrrM